VVHSDGIMIVRRVLQCDAVCCSVLKYVAACCSVVCVLYVLQCASFGWHRDITQCIAVCCSVLQRAVVCSVCSMCCSVLHSDGIVI